MPSSPGSGRRGARIALRTSARQPPEIVRGLGTTVHAQIEDGLAGVQPDDLIGDWRHVIVGFLDALDHHPLARRVLAGLEPDFTVRLIGIPALDQLRKGLAESLETLQLSGAVRDDIDTRAMANGFMTIWLSLLMSLVQTGSSPVDLLGEEVVAVFDAVMRPVRPR